MEIIAISDTHGQHKSLSLPKGDVIIHAGDVSKRGRPAEVEDFLDWFGSLDFKHKIFVAGNHDFLFESADPEIIQSIIPKGVTYLNDSGIDIDGVKIWGSPITPWFYDWAFNRERGGEIREHWELIPDDTTILITHGPPCNILDETVYSQKVGCEDLALKILQIKPLYHVFGHIHESYGLLSKDDITYVNASVLNDRYELVNEPIVFSL
jgi:Icc-related predicted phosphoesterase